MNLYDIQVKSERLVMNGMDIRAVCELFIDWIRLEASFSEHRF